MDWGFFWSNLSILASTQTFYPFVSSRADVSTGELITLEGISITQLCEELIRLDASELIIGSEEEESLLLKHNKQIKCTVTKKTCFALAEATKTIKEYYKIGTLEGLGLKNYQYSTQSSGGLLAYIKQINPSEFDNDSSVKISLSIPQIKFPYESLIIDYQTKKNFPERSFRKKKKGLETCSKNVPGRFLMTVTYFLHFFEL